MNPDLLDADCVIRHLHNINIISLTEWKNRHPSDQCYNVFFAPANNRKGDVGLNIIKRSGRYYVSRSLINVISYRHSFDASNIYRECAV